MNDNSFPVYLLLCVMLTFTFIKYILFYILFHKPYEYKRLKKYT